MEPDMTLDQVLNELRRLSQNGESLSKKKMKQNHPELLKNALYYFPSWEHALQNL